MAAIADIPDAEITALLRTPAEMALMKAMQARVRSGDGDEEEGEDEQGGARDGEAGGFSREGLIEGWDI